MGICIYSYTGFSSSTYYAYVQVIIYFSYKITVLLDSATWQCYPRLSFKLDIHDALYIYSK